ncbi:MAG: glutathione S-transferase [Thermoleophilaceae bacterium]|jgi:glutathione S-transferase|nr:glutathione S-transferase [Thermoleophilaceae bacterium]
MGATLFVIPGSHPSWSARLMLERKGIEYRRLDLVAAIHRPILRMARFPGRTVPALIMDGRRVQGTRAIAEAIEELRPEPPLFPSDPVKRAAVDEAERFGDQELQSVARRITWWAIQRDRAAIRTFLEGARVGMPAGMATAVAGPFVRASVRYNHADDERVRADLADLAGMLDRIDAWIADGVLGSDEPNVADYQIATSVRLLMCSDDLRPGIEGRPAGQHALKIVPDFPGRIAPVLGPVLDSA